MHRPVEFDGQTFLRTEEINDIWSNAVLTPEAPSFELTLTQILP